MYSISVADTGINFEIETLNNLGIKKSSTHVDNGGSGIGYMSIFEILTDVRCSLTIEENNGILNNTYKKVVRIEFNGKFKYIIKSFRISEIKEIVNRRDVVLLES